MKVIEYEKLLNKVKDKSILLFHKTCLYYGNEDVIALRRRFKDFEDFFWQKVRPNLNYIEYTTGGIIDGFRIGKTDRDFLCEMKYVHLEKKPESHDISSSLLLEMCPDYSDFWKEGYVLLKLKPPTSITRSIEILPALDLETGIVSSSKFKEMHLSMRAKIEEPGLFIHGPSVSNYGIYSDMDTVIAFKCPFWPVHAEEWKTRQRFWPQKKIVDKIEKAGCHVVPNGPNPNSKLWKLSFNIAEKMLIYSFNHTQLICFALLKSFYKDYIKNDSLYVEDSLCSYFLKTLVFWIVQDTHPDLWRINNLFTCFCLCFGRLIMWVKDRNCPNFFIPQRNMFRFKLCLKKKENLLRILTTCYEKGLFKQIWYCIPPAPVPEIHSKQNLIDEALFRELRILLTKWLGSWFPYNELDSIWHECVQNTREMSEDELKSKLNCCVLKQESLLSQIRSDYDKDKGLVSAILNFVHLTQIQKVGLHSKNRTCRLWAFLMSKNLDLTRGSTFLANFYYVENQFKKVIDLTSDILCHISECTMYIGINVVRIRSGGKKLYDSKITSKHLSWADICKQFVALDIILIKELNKNDPTYSHLNIVPKELHVDMVFQRYMMVIPSLVYVHFLRFICFMHLEQFDQCWKSLKEMIQCTDDVCLRDDLGMAFLIIGICFEHANYYQEALYYYVRSYKLRPIYSSAVYRACNLAWKLLQRQKYSGTIKQR